MYTPLSMQPQCVLCVPPTFNLQNDFISPLFYF